MGEPVYSQAPVRLQPARGASKRSTAIAARFMTHSDPLDAWHTSASRGTLPRAGRLSRFIAVEPKRPSAAFAFDGSIAPSREPIRPKSAQCSCDRAGLAFRRPLTWRPPTHLAELRRAREAAASIRMRQRRPSCGREFGLGMGRRLGSEPGAASRPFGRPRSTRAVRRDRRAGAAKVRSSRAPRTDPWSGARA